MMLKLTLAFALLTITQAALADVYKCEVNGKTEYQATPCAKGIDISNKVKQPQASNLESKTSENKKCTGKEVRIDFSDMPVQTTLHVLADFSGNQLAADPTINSSGAFHYNCMPWDTVLQDIARKYKLDIKVENGTIFAKKK